MSFGSGGGFSFGSNNNNQSSGFGGFGSNNNTNTGFGANNTSNTTFGSANATSNPFGGSTFGSNTQGGGFGASTSGSSLFGNKSTTNNPFGASTSNSGGLFGSNTNTNSGGFGGSSGFGSNTTAGFGSGNTNSSFSFGNNANKPAFGSSTTTPLFGQGGAGTTGTGGFGAGNAFGSTGSGTALGQAVPPSEGTAVQPFAPTNEKETPSATTTSSYQSINFMQPYQKYSFEELRLADYNAGRRFGNGSGQAGAFGSNNFGGFGATNTGGGFGSNTSTGLFGSNNTSNTTTTSGFGSNTATTGFGGGGLFGNKPATSGGLFGQQSSGTSSGGLFGTANNTTTNAFGSGSTGFGSNTGSSLFGNNNQQNQNKPSLFGNTNNAAGTSSGFSFGNNTNTTNTNATGGGLFGNNSNTNNAFGGANQQQSTGLFGGLNNSNNNAQNKSLFGGNATGGFGSTNTQASGGLFGNTGASNTGTGLFGNTNTNTNTAGGLFGNNTNTGGSLFGNNANNNAAKPGGLFGGSTFGNNANTSTTGNSLFGNNTNNNQTSGGMFGNANTNTGSGFNFGNANANKPTTSLFGNTSTNQSAGLFGSTNAGSGLFNSSQSNQQNMQQQQDAVKHSSLLDPNPYGQSSIWTGLPAPTADNSKPVFTPLSATQKMKESQSKPPPTLRLNQSRYMTPPRRGGFGFSYSTYGTPNSAASTPGTTGLSGSMYGSRGFTGGSFGRSLGKSASISNLRSHFNSESDGVLTPGAFAPSSSRYSSGSIRRLTIDRSIRTDLFTRSSQSALPAPPANSNGAGNTINSSAANGATPQEPVNKLKKRVSFDKDTTGGQTNGELNGETGALVRTEVNEEEEQTPPASSSRARSVNGVSSAENESSRGKELAIVPEDRESDNVVSKMRLPSDVQAKPDPKPGDYWMKPSRAEMSKISREKLQRFVNFEVGRQGCGKVVFNGAVDLTALQLDDLYDKIVEIRLRSVTVYPDASSKPPVGKGLNVPSTISIENSWPRARNQPSSATSGPVFEKHVNRLKKMHGTEFVDYEVATGVWTFKVPHYTRYGLDYDDEDDLSQSRGSMMSDLPADVESGDASSMEVDSDNYEDSAEDDTFAFKQKFVPGGFGRRSGIDYESDASIVRSIEDGDESDRQGMSGDESENEQSMAGSFPALPPVELLSPRKSILKQSVLLPTPGKALLDLDGDWADQLQRTISPRKQNRDDLRATQNRVLLDRTYEPIRPQATTKKDFRTSIDVMNSLFSKPMERKGMKGGKQARPDFEFPYNKRSKTFDPSDTEMTAIDKAWHDSFKPRFTTNHHLVYQSRGGQENGDEWTSNIVLDNEGQDIVVGGLRSRGVEHFDIKTLMTHATIRVNDGVPAIRHNSAPLSSIRDQISQQNATSSEVDLYELLHILFDEYDDEFTFGLSDDQQKDFKQRIQKDRLDKFWSSLIWRQHGDQIKNAEKENAARAALLHLTSKNVHAACDALMEEKDFHLTMMLAQIEQADDTFQNDIKSQIDAWREQNIISEMTEEIRALYEILSGNTTISQGNPSGPVEDRAQSFNISERFGLAWLQAFSLCMWYGKNKNGDIGEIVNDFQHLLSDRLETASPVLADGNDDPLWVVLKIFASLQKVRDVQMPTLPQALGALSKSWDDTSAFRLHHALVAKLGRSSLKLNHDKEDQMAADLAFQYEARGTIPGAIWALLHIKAAATRKEMIQNVLLRNAGNLPNPPEFPSAQDSQQLTLWPSLVTDLKIPTQWICRAKAMFARSENSSFEELKYLILAEDLESAHECLCRRVAPRLVIDEDWTTLHEVLSEFGNDIETKIPDWASGGGIYSDLISLLLPNSNDKPQDTKSRRTILGRMHKTLSEKKSSLSITKSSAVDGNQGLEERIAWLEMGRLVAGLLENAGASGNAILDLELTADVKLNHARNMSALYYQRVMATAR